MHTFTVLIDLTRACCKWIDNDKLFDLNPWEGDKIFLRWLEQPAFFSGWMKYVDGKLVEHSVVFYEAGKLAELERGRDGEIGGTGDGAYKTTPI